MEKKSYVIEEPNVKKIKETLKFVQGNLEVVKTKLNSINVELSYSYNKLYDDFLAYKVSLVQKMVSFFCEHSFSYKIRF